MARITKALGFQDMPIRQKLLLIIMTTCTVSLSLVFLSNLVYERISYRNSLIRDLSSLANVVGYNCAAALSFNDPVDATETLASLKAKRCILSAWVYNKAGETFAHYLRNDRTKPINPPELQEAGYCFKNDQLGLCKPIILDGHEIGTVTLQSDLKEMQALLGHHLKILVFLFLLSFLVALLVSSKLQRTISNPILNLARLAKSVSKEKNYSLRAEKHSANELGSLIDAFNEMLEQIQARDSALLDAKQKAELTAKEAQKLAEETRQINLQLSNEIAERKKIEQALRESEEKYRSLFEQSRDAIYITTRDGDFVDMNRAGMDLFGYTRKELLRINARKLNVYPDARKRYQHEIEQKGFVKDYRVRFRRKDGTEIDCLLTATVRRAKDGSILGYQGIIRDITEQNRMEKELKRYRNRLEELIKERTKQLSATNRRLEREIAERRQAEERLKISLEEKVALLGEVHHRVKNNLQVIASLLEMSKTRATNQDAINLLSEAHAKIYTMALIHTQLYESDRFDQINMEEHCRSLINYLQHLYTKNQNIHYTLNANNIRLSVTQAIPCGLILNELISNAFKHAFRDTREGLINVLMEKSTEETISLKVKDNGMGMPKEVNVDQTDTLGLKLVRNLVEKQLGGRLDIKRNEGTEILIEFKISGG